jgi:hypothetical protein
MTRRVLALATLAVLAACGGGGGSSPTPPVVTPTAGPSSTASPTPTARPSGSPTATPTASPTPSGAAVTGVVKDSNGNPLAGAAVYVGTSFPAGATAPGSGTVSTGASGAFTVTGIASGTPWVVVWPPAGSSETLPVYHAQTAVSGSTSLGTITLDVVDSVDAAGLASINSYRSSLGEPAYALDEVETDAARLQAAYVNANPGVTLSNPTPAQQYEAAHGEPQANWSTGGAYSVAEDGGSLAANWGGVVQGWQSIAAGCPQPPAYATCPDWSVGNASATWIGLGLVADTQSGAAANSEFFDAEFGTLP